MVSGQWSVVSGQWSVVSGTEFGGRKIERRYTWVKQTGDLEGEQLMAIKSYRDLIVWQKAMDLVEDVYKKTKGFPREELYGLTSQLRRAVVSVPSNNAEGQGRNSTKEFLHHLSIAYGSLCEVETQCLLPTGSDILKAVTLTVLRGSLQRSDGLSMVYQTGFPGRKVELTTDH